MECQDWGKGRDGTGILGYDLQADLHGELRVVAAYVPHPTDKVGI